MVCFLSLESDELIFMMLIEHARSKANPVFNRPVLCFARVKMSFAAGRVGAHHMDRGERDLGRRSPAAVIRHCRRNECPGNGSGRYGPDNFRQPTALFCVRAAAKTSASSNPASVRAA